MVAPNYKMVKVIVQTGLLKLNLYGLHANTQQNCYQQASYTEGAQARQNARSDHVCLEFSLVTFFFSRKRK